MLSSRLEFIGFSSCCVAHIVSSTSARSAPNSYKHDRSDSQGCVVGASLLRGDAVSDNVPIYKLQRTTGNPKMDIALDGALKKLADLFGVFPEFGFVDDGSSPNAWASPLPRGKGTVAFGITYYQKWMNYDPSGLSVLATLAHECGHIKQFFSGKYLEIEGDLSTSKRIELHADYMSGYYMGVLKRRNPDTSFWKAGDKFRQIGSQDDKDPDFHGTPQERIAASQQGFNVGFFETRDANFAFQSGMDYVSRR
jgi:hypothetical protein